MSAGESNGRPLPDALRAAIEDGRWAPPADDVLARVFGDEPQGASYYSLAYMAEENRAWPSVEDGLPIYHGSPDPSAPPGDIDPRASVLIGDLGYDMPFALDFRTSREEPRVVYLSLVSGCWVFVVLFVALLLVWFGLG